jgi:hypothetical protein
VSHYKFVFTGDVWFDVQWMIHERSRYESDASPDVDNVLKPLIDAFCGPQGLLIDDGQVQAVGCHWVDWTRADERLTVTIKFSPDDWLRKEGLMFVRMDRALCMPVPGGLSRQQLTALLTMYESQFETRRKMENLGADYLRQVDFCVDLHAKNEEGRFSGLRRSGLASIA